MYQNFKKNLQSLEMEIVYLHVCLILFFVNEDRKIENECTKKYNEVKKNLLIL